MISFAEALTNLADEYEEDGLSAAEIISALKEFTAAREAAASEADASEDEDEDEDDETKG